MKAFLLIKKWFFRLKCRHECRAKDFSIISQNCIGGVIYHNLHRKFLSPTINGFLINEDFVKLAENPEHYFGVDAKAANKELFPDINYPVLAIDDVYFFGVHYHDTQRAIEDWNRRRHRINFSKLVVIANEWDLGGNPALIARIQALPIPKLIFVFSEKYNGAPNCLFLDKKYIRRGMNQYPLPMLLDYAPNGYAMYFENDFPIYRLLSDLVNC